MQCRVLLRAAWFSLALYSVASGQSKDSKAILEEMKGVFTRVLNADIRGTSSTFAKGWNLSEEVKMYDSTFQITSSDDYWLISTRDNGKVLANRKLVSQKSGFDYVLGPEGALLCEWFDGKAKNVDIDQRGKSHSQVLEKGFGIQFLGVSAIIFGFLDGHKKLFLPDVLADSSVEQIPNSGVAILRKDGAFGTWEARIDVRTLLPLEISIELDGNDFFGTKRVSEYGPTGNSDRLYPNRQLKRVSRKLHFSSRTLDNGENMIVKISSRQQMEYAGGVLFELRSIVTVDHILRDRQSDDKFLFARLEIPDNTPVQLAHAPQLPYVWKAGKAVKGLPPRDDHELPLPFRRRGSSRFALVFGSVAVIAVVLGTIWWRRKLTSA